MARKNASRFTITQSISPTPMSQAEWEACEDMLARMVARAIAIDQGWLKIEETPKKGCDQDG